MISVTRNWYKGVIVSQRQWRRRLFWIAVKSDGLNACVVHPRGILELEDFAIGETKGVMIQAKQKEFGYKTRSYQEIIRDEVEWLKKW